MFRLETHSFKRAGSGAALAALLALGAAPQTFAHDDDDGEGARGACRGLPSHAALTAALAAVVGPGNTGLANDMWATVVNEDGIVCAVTFSGGDRNAQWPASRAISAQKANTANSLSLSAGDGGAIPGLALSTANLWAATQPGGSLFGLQFSNPVDTDVAYRGNAARYGQRNDPIVGRKIGGVNVFGGGLALYDAAGTRIGGLGLSGDTSCSDHIQSWKVRDGLGLDNVPAGLSGPAPGQDNIIFDLVDDAGGNPESPSGFGHPTCLDDAGEKAAAADLPVSFPVGPNP